MNRRSLLLALSLWTAGAALHAQTNSEATTLYVPFPAGGSSDVFARTLAPTLSKQLQRTLIVENLAGASGSIAATCDVSDHRVMYEWQTAIGQSPTDWTSEPPTNSSRTGFSGYTPGTWLNCRVRFRVPAGAGDWSSAIQIMVV